MALLGIAAMRHVDAGPAVAFHPNVGPRVTRGLRGVARMDVAADVARRYPGGAAAGDEEMRMILADAAADRERLRGRAGDFGNATFVLHSGANCLGKRNE